MIETKFIDTEIGKLPEEWSTKPLGQICSIHGRIGFRGYTKKDLVKKHEGAITYSPSDIKNQVLYNNDCDYISLSKYEESPEIKVFNGDILFCKTASIGKCAIVENLKELATINPQFVVLKDFNCHNRFLYYILAQSDFQERVKEITGGSTIPTMSQEKLKEQFVPIPKIEEQIRISTSLSNIDNLISSLNKLIEKKKNIKQGAMQQLLTGKKRLKEFSESWIEKKLGLIGITYSGLTGKTKEDFGTGNAKYITFLNVLNNPILNPKQFEYVVIKDGERQNNCRCGDIFFNTSSETPEEVGICAMLDTSMDNLYLNSFCFGYRLTDSNVVPEYLAYYFRSDEGRKLMTVLAQGVTRYNMSKSAFNNAKILMPSNASEQKAITDVLISMDKEIESLKLKKAKYESVKQGMMQQLLTGKIRLV